MTLAQNQFSEFVDDLRETHGQNLVSVILYGSAAAGDFVASKSDYNMLITLREIRPKDLRAAQAPMREWQRMGHPLPVYFTYSELKNAADVFPIEFHQMEKARRVLYGEDVLADLNITDKFLRHQTEYELRSKLIQLRRFYIPASADLERLKDLLADSLASFAALFRAVLILHGVESPVTKREIVELTCRKIGLNSAPFEKIFTIREKDASNALDEVSANRLFSDYMNEIEKVIDSVDMIRKT